MDLWYRPKNFCKDYAAVKGSSQLLQFMAVVKGIKPLMDDWVDINQYSEFKKICLRHKLKAEPDWAFIEKPDNMINNALDSDRLSTTKFYGKPYNKNIKIGQVHVFISKYEEQILEAKKFGWYPLIVNGRAMHKPLIDHSRFGKVLGYPDCCIMFFRDFNNYHVYNHPYETYKNTDGAPNFLCNNFLMDDSFSLIHHLPCSYSCKKTFRFAKELLDEVEKEEPDYAEKIRHYLKLPFLVFQERDIYLFEGKRRGNKIFYSDFCFIGRPKDAKYKDTFRKGNNLTVSKNKIEVFDDSALVFSIPKEKEENGFLIEFR